MSARVRVQDHEISLRASISGRNAPYRLCGRGGGRPHRLSGHGSTPIVEPNRTVPLTARAARRNHENSSRRPAAAAPRAGTGPPRSPRVPPERAAAVRARGAMRAIGSGGRARRGVRFGARGQAREHEEELHSGKGSSGSCLDSDLHPVGTRAPLVRENNRVTVLLIEQVLPALKSDLWPPYRGGLRGGSSLLI